jgi:hypothetical protein
MHRITKVKPREAEVVPHIKAGIAVEVEVGREL